MTGNGHPWWRMPPSAIRLGSESDVAYWTRELGVDEAALRLALAAVGPEEIGVRHYLQREPGTPASARATAPRVTQS
jgi:hypothetical protein